MTTTTERLARYETAQQILGFLVATCAERMYLESKKPNPDTAKIAEWEAEQDAYVAEDAALFYSDPEAVERVIAVYGPQARALFMEDRKST